MSKNCNLQMVAQFCEFNKNDLLVQLAQGNFMKSKWHLNKAVFQKDCLALLTP